MDTPVTVISQIHGDGETPRRVAGGTQLFGAHDLRRLGQ